MPDDANAGERHHVERRLLVCRGPMSELLGALPLNFFHGDPGHRDVSVHGEVVAGVELLTPPCVPSKRKFAAPRELTALPYPSGICVTACHRVLLHLSS